MRPTLATAIAALRSGDPCPLRELLTGTLEVRRLIADIRDELRNAPPETVASALQQVHAASGDPASSWPWEADPSPLVPWALALVSDRSPAVRLGAIRLLDFARASEAEAPLAQVVRHDEVCEVRLAAAEALGGIASPASTGALALREVIAAGCPAALYARALLSLALIPDPEAGPRALRALEHHDPVVRRAGAQALFDLWPAQPPETYGELMRALVREPDQASRERLVAALHRTLGENSPGLGDMVELPQRDRGEVVGVLPASRPGDPGRLLEVRRCSDGQTSRYRLDSIRPAEPGVMGELARPRPAGMER